MRSSKVLLCATLGLFSSVHAAAQVYREGQPRVMEPVTSQPARPGWERLRSVLTELGSPRFVVFWDRKLDAEIATGYRERETESLDVQAGREASGHTVAGWNVRSGSSSASGSLHAESTKEKRTERVGTPETARESPLEKAFTGELRRGGLRFVDSTIAIRQVGAGVTGERPNYQAVEWQGLTRYADYLLQVTSQPEGDQRVYLVSIRNLKDGEIIVDFSSSASTTGAPAYVATERGFEPQEADRDARMRTLASETAEKLRLALADVPRVPRPAAR